MRRKQIVGKLADRCVWSLTAIVAAALGLSSPSYASTVYLTRSYQTGNSCNNCGPFGSVTVSQVSASEVQVTLNLASGNLFAIVNGNGAGKPLLFDVSVPITNFQMVTAPTNSPGLGAFTLSQAPPVIMADGTGPWNDAVVCSSGCKTGVSGNYSGTLSFYLFGTGISPASFVANTNGLTFASDIGVPAGYTGDVATTASTASVPLPAAAWLLLSGLGGLGALTARSRTPFAGARRTRRRCSLGMGRSSPAVPPA